MKRGLRTLIGIAVMVAFVFAGGFLGDAKAMEDGSRWKHWDESLISNALGKINNIVYNIDSISNIKIIRNTTVSSKTYSGNVKIDNGVTFTVGNNSNIIVNGILDVDGRLNISSGTLTVNGDLIVDKNGVITASGTAKIVVNKSVTGNRADPYGGNLVVWNDLMGCTGLLNIKDSANVTVNKAKDNIVLLRGSLIMSSAATKLTANVSTFVAQGSSTLTAGTIVINGDFLQDELLMSIYTYAPSDEFNTIIQGTPSVPRRVIFNTRGNNYITNYNFIGVVFTSDSWIPIKHSLTSDTIINGNNSHILYYGNLNGNTLTINAKYTYGGSIDFSGGCLIANGTFINDDDSRIRMTTDQDRLIVNGNFETHGRYSQFSKGRLTVNGNLYATMSSNTDCDTYVPTQDFITEISGNNRLVKFDFPQYAYISNLELSTGATLDPSSIISLNCTLKRDLILPCTVDFRGVMDSYNLTARNLIVPGNSSLDVQNGKLTATGDMTLYGQLKMNYENSFVEVNGCFTAAGNSNDNNLTNGKLYIKGDFIQQGSLGLINAKSFRATGNHMTILNGSGDQKIEFKSGDMNTGSKFAHLIVVNEKLDTSSLPAFRDDLAVTGLTMKIITVSGAILSPVFNSNIHDYDILLPTFTDSVTITPAFMDRYSGNEYLTVGDDMVTHVTDIVVTSVPYDGVKEVTVWAHAASNVVSAPYNFRVMQINSDLRSLGTLPEGSKLEPDFDPAVHSYTVQIPETAVSFTWAPTADHPESAVHIDAADGPSSMTIALAPGESATHTAGVIAQDGTTEGAYTVIFTRRNPISSISVSTTAPMTPPAVLSPQFSKDTANYTVNIPANVNSATITVNKNVVDCSDLQISIGGAVQTIDPDNPGIEISPVPGGTSVVTIAAKDAGGLSTTTYTVTVKRVALLTGIGLSGGAALTPAFAAETSEYNVYVANTAASVTVTPVKGTGCTATIDGAAVASKVVTVASGGKKTVTIACTGPQGIKQTYTVNIYRNAPIQGIGITGGTLSPAFSVTTTSYTVSVPATATSVKITPTPGTYCSDMTINDAAATYLTVTPIVGQNIPVTIKAKAADGSLFTYTVTVKRAALVTNIVASPGTMVPAFNPTVTDYTIDVPVTTTQVKITPTKAAAGVKSMTINGAAVTYAYIKPPVGGSAKATIYALATDLKTKVTYTVTVRRAALLDGITLSTGTLSPAFIATTSAYTVSIPADETTVTVTPVKALTGVKSMTINGAVKTSLDLKPVVGGKATATIVLTATDGVTKSTYTVTAVRAPIITGIGVSAGALSPAFNTATTSYTINLPATAASVTITPAKAPVCTGLNINTVDQNSVTLYPAIGGSSTATIVGTTGAGTPVTYTVIAKRATLVTSIRSSLTTAPLSPAFNPLTSDYTITIPATATSVTVYATKATSGVKSMTMNGAAVTSVIARPVIGGSAKVTIIATATDNIAKSTYTVTVYRRELATGIALSGGYELSPAFDPVKSTYTVRIPADETTVTVTPVKALTGVKSMTINGAVKTSLDLKPVVGGKAVATIVLTATDGITKSTYTVTAVRDPIVTGIAVAGGTLGPVFNAATTSYVITMPATSSSVTITPAISDICSGMKIDNIDQDFITLSPAIGSSYTFTIKGKTAAGTTVTYTVKVNHMAMVTSIRSSSTAYTLAPAFNPATVGYEISIPSTMSSITVYATKATTGVKSMTMNGAAVTSVIARPTVGGSTVITVVATAADGITKDTYMVTVKRATLLDDITLSTSALSPAFATSTYAYTVNIPADETTVTVTPNHAATNFKSMTINGAAVPSLDLKPAVGGRAVATIVLTATDGITKITYAVTAVRAPIITGIGVSAGVLSPVFNTATTSYTLNLTASTPSVTLTPAKAPVCTGLNINTVDQDSVTLSPVIGGSATATIVGTTDAGTPVTYTVIAKRAALVTNIRSSLTTTPLSPAYNPLTTDYTITIPATTTYVTVYATKAAAGVKSMTMNGAAVTSIIARPAVGGSTVITVVATASDGVTKDTYKVTVKRNALLTGITLSTGALSPAFAATTPTYTVNIPATTDSVTITPVKALSGVRSMTINGAAKTSLDLKPAVGGYATATIVLTATDGITKSTYTVKVVRHGPLTGIGITGGALSPAFASWKTSYDVYIPGNASSVTITPTKTTGSSYAINGGTANTPALISLDPGGTATASIVATAPGGVAQITYTVTVHRAGLLTGITAADPLDETKTFALSPSFSSTTTSYQVILGAGTDKARVKPTATAGCSFTMDGNPDEYVDVTLESGEQQTITIEVTGADGKKMTYMVQVQRALSLEGITATGSTSSALTLMPSNDPFDRDTFAYSVAATTGETVTITPQISSHISTKINGEYRSSITVDSSTPVVEIVCEPVNSLTPVTYTVTISWSDPIPG